LRNSIAVKLSLGLGLLLVMILVAAGMSFWQSDAVDKRTNKIVQNLEPKMATAYEMELSSLEIEMGSLDYTSNPDFLARTRGIEKLTSFDQFDYETLALANGNVVSATAVSLDELSSEFVRHAEIIMDQADLKRSLLVTLEDDFYNLDRFG